MKQSYFVVPFMLALLAVGIWSCDGDETQNHPDRNWTLAWSDEFDGAAGTSPDSTKWVYDIGTGANGWGNNELQYYTDRPENVSHDGDGHLNITTRGESYMGSSYTSARIKTQGTFAQTYGRYEARIQVPSGPGIWPAFWLLGDNITEVSWPQCGEIDVMELVGTKPHEVHGSLHGPGYSAGNAITESHVIDGRFDGDFHTYAVEWGKDYIDYFVDGYWYQRITPDDVAAVGGEWVFDHSFHMILNTAMGGAFVGAFDPATTTLPQTMKVDYVRVYTQN